MPAGRGGWEKWGDGGGGGLGMDVLSETTVAGMFPALFLSMTSEFKTYDSNSTGVAYRVHWQHLCYLPLFFARVANTILLVH